jgi:lipopolysaccharide/colanic/teichoic acid biosynthesis glycosyltransferase
VRPGLTGLWQVSERGDKPMHECTEADVRYVEVISFVTDLKIIVKTPVAALFSNRGY